MQIWAATFIVEYWVRSNQPGSNYVGDSYHKIHDSASDLTSNSEIKDYVALSELSVTLYTFLTANMNRKSQSRQLGLLYFQKVFYRSCLSNHIHRLLITVGSFKMGSGTSTTFLLLRCCGKRKYFWFICLFHELLTTLNILPFLTLSEKAGRAGALNSIVASLKWIFSNNQKLEYQYCCKKSAVTNV